MIIIRIIRIISNGSSLNKKLGVYIVISYDINVNIRHIEAYNSASSMEEITYTKPSM